MTSISSDIQINRCPLKVVWYHKVIPLGGAETVTIDLATFLSLRFPHIEPIILTSELTATIPGITTYELSKEFTPDTPNGRHAIIDLLKQIKASVFIQVVDAPQGWLTELRKAMPELKILFHLHSIPLWQVKDKCSGHLSRIIREKLFHTISKRIIERYREDYAASDYWIALCKPYTDILRQRLGNRVITMYNPIDVDRFLPLRELTKQKEVLYLGRLTKSDKRVDRILASWRSLHKSHPDWRLKIVGKGPDEARLQHLANKYKLTNIEFCGHSHKPEEHYATAAIVCMTSEFEGWPLVLIEAATSGAKVLAMECSAGIAEMRKKIDITTVKAGDQRAFTKQLEQLIVETDSNSITKIAPPSPFLLQLDKQHIASQWAVFFENLAN